MDYFALIFVGLFVLVVGNLVWARLKHGSWTGAFLKGSIVQTYGEIELSRSSTSSEVLKIVALRDGDGEALVGLIVTSKAPLAAALTPYRLSKDQARELAALLQLAAT